MWALQKTFTGKSLEKESINTFYHLWHSWCWFKSNNNQDRLQWRWHFFTCSGERNYCRWRILCKDQLFDQLSLRCDLESSYGNISGESLVKRSGQWHGIKTYYQESGYVYAWSKHYKGRICRGYHQSPWDPLKQSILKTPLPIQKRQQQ